MNDKDRDLLVQTLHEAGKIGETGFAALVRWQFTDGVTTVLFTLVGLAFLSFLSFLLMRWKPRDEAAMAKGFGLCVIALVVTILITAALPAGIREIASPEGAAVAYVLSHH